MARQIGVGSSDAGSWGGVNCRSIDLKVGPRRVGALLTGLATTDTFESAQGEMAERLKAPVC